MRTIVALGFALALVGQASAQEASADATETPAAVSTQGLPNGLVATGEPAFVATGQVGKGEPIVRVPVRHAYTGHVTKTVPGVLFSKTIVAGAPAFGMPMVSSKGGPQVVWCAPVATDSRPGKEAWSTNCFVEIPTGATQMVMSGGLYPTMLSTGQALFAAPLEVTPGPADFGVPLSLNYVFRKWNAAGEAEMMVEVRWPRRAAYIGIVSAKRTADGAVVNVLGGEILLTPTPDGRSASIRLVKPPNLEAQAE